MQQAYARSMDVLHGDMVLGIADPVPDIAFARGMLPHHMGAVDMAKIQLKYGTNEEMRQLAQEIIDDQKPEITLMQNWLANVEAAEASKTVNDENEDAKDEPQQSVS